MTSLQDHPQRICIIGPSNSGKSTLADRLGKQLDLRIVHLDQIAHEPNTNWKRRPKEDFLADHDRLIQEERWIMDGNYSEGLPQRLDRATSVIWLDFSRLGCLARYFARCLKRDPNRKGRLEGALKEFNLSLVEYIWLQYPKNRKRYAALLAKRPNLPVLRLRSMRELNRHTTRPYTWASQKL